jgi:AbrB family looped-hinge helix DNA binding protein
MLEARATLTEGGRIVIPAQIRKALNIHIGDEVLLKLESGELHIVTLQNVVKDAQKLVRQYNEKNLSLKKTLFSMRKEDTKDDS